MAYALVIFDFDGTLADSAPWFHANINVVARRYRFRQIEPGDVDRLRRQDTAAIIRDLGVPRWKLPFIAAHMRDMMAADIGSIALFPGVRECLEELHGAGVRLAIVSSNALENVRRVLGPQSASLVDHFGCGSSVFGKAEKFRRVLRAARIEPGDAIAIGDEVRDIEAARATGLAAGAVTWGYAAPAFLVATRPDILFESVGAIGPYVRGFLPNADPPIVPLTRSTKPG